MCEKIIKSAFLSGLLQLHSFCLFLSILTVFKLNDNPSENKKYKNLVKFGSMLKNLKLRT